MVVLVVAAVAAVAIAVTANNKQQTANSKQNIKNRKLQMNEQLSFFSPSLVSFYLFALSYRDMHANNLLLSRDQWRIFNIRVHGMSKDEKMSVFILVLIIRLT